MTSSISTILLTIKLAFEVNRSCSTSLLLYDFKIFRRICWFFFRFLLVFCFYFLFVFGFLFVFCYLFIKLGSAFFPVKDKWLFIAMDKEVSYIPEQQYVF